MKRKEITIINATDEIALDETLYGTIQKLYKKENPLSIEMININKKEKPYLHQHGGESFIVVFTGNGTLVISGGNKKQLLKKGDFININPNIECSIVRKTPGSTLGFLLIKTKCT